MRALAAVSGLALALLACSPAQPGADASDASDVSNPSDVGDASADAAHDAASVDSAEDVVRPGYRCARPQRADGGAGEGGVDAGLCNGAASLCDRRFNEVAYATTHNAFAVDAENFGAPNQSRSMRQQLDDGVRGLMLDVYTDQNRTYLCHGFCSLGRRLLSDGLCEVTKFLDEHPTEVVSIIFESYVGADDVERSFTESGLIERVRPQAVGAPWPTLREMIARDQRVVVFTDREGGARPWYLNVWAHAWETPFSARTPSELDTCMMNRGDRANPLFIFNHFLTNPLASRELAMMVNPNPFLLARAQRCQRETGALPNFITVDYYDIGDALSVTRTLNGL